ncbi:hypothetical protein [Kitasatospora sp. NPDC050543]|uniref:hypothetical protein n=1 Tax=Kitasatospora sp. NPDC050543 TaxID=3364054 RepID=UPI0037AC1072
MLRPLLVVPLLAAAAGGVWLSRGALLRWRDLRSAQTYELAGDQRPMLLRAVGAMLCGLCVTVLTVLVAVGALGTRGAGGAGEPSVEEARAEAGPRPAAAPPDGPGTPAPSPGAPASAPVPSASASSGASAGAPASASAPVAATASGNGPAPVVSHFDSIGHPAGGELMESAVAGPDGRPRTVRVWLPEQYAQDPKARFPVIVLHAAGARKTADTEVPDVFDSIASAVTLGRSRPFVVVVPQAPSGTEHPCELVTAAPQAVSDDASLRTVVAAAFRTLPPGPANWGVLGVEAGAPCAAAAGLARADLYGAAAAVSGRYDNTALTAAGAEAPAGAAPKLLLAAAKADSPGLDAARKLQGALRGGAGQAAKADVRISDIVEDYTPERVRTRLVRVAVQYLAETLAQPS